MFPTNQIFGYNFNNLELYPRRRATEFYYEPQPLEDYQSRQAEHPQDKLQYNKNDNSNWQNEMDNTRIAPATNSDMRMYRSSYFS
ncbi:uncharacterized protein ACRADG_011284 [Cochliomyia hominivorax]